MPVGAEATTRVPAGTPSGPCHALFITTGVSTAVFSSMVHVRLKLVPAYVPLELVTITDGGGTVDEHIHIRNTKNTKKGRVLVTLQSISIGIRN